MRTLIYSSFLFLLGYFFVLTPAFSTDIENLKQYYKRPITIPFPNSNPYQAEKAALGKMLFFDPRLSEHQNMSCASCHNPSFGWEGALARSVGSQNTKLDRHSPTVLNMAWVTSFFWDGRAKTLEEQALGPIQSKVEMNLSLEELVARISSINGYKNLFNKLFSDGISYTNVAKAIATFERTIVSGIAPFDKWVNGDESAITESAKRGFVLFNEKAQCATCHSGWNFTDNRFHDIGLPTTDSGRINIDASTKLNQHAFKTPGLRNISQRAPYMHNGELPTLESVLTHYVSGGIQRESISPLMTPVPLSPSDLDDLKAFLETLQGKDKPMTLPMLPL